MCSLLSIWQLQTEEGVKSTGQRSARQEGQGPQAGDTVPMQEKRKKLQYRSGVRDRLSSNIMLVC